VLVRKIHHFGGALIDPNQHKGTSLATRVYSSERIVGEVRAKGVVTGICVTTLVLSPPPKPINYKGHKQVIK
jgi:hypothetical protein